MEGIACFRFRRQDIGLIFLHLLFLCDFVGNAVEFRAEQIG